MPNGKSKYFFIPVLLGDMFIMMLAFSASYYFVADSSLHLINYIFNYFIASVLWVLIVLRRKIYDIPRFLRIEKILMENVEALIIFFFIGIALLFFFRQSFGQRILYISIFGVFAIFQLTWHTGILLKIKQMRIRGLNFRKVVLVGINKNMDAMIERIQRSPDVGYQIAGLFTNSENSRRTSEIYKGRLDEVMNFCENNQVHHMIISLPHHQSDFINELLHFGDNHLIRVKIIPEFSEYLSQTFFIDYIDHTPMLRFRDEPLESLSNKLIKRAFDIIFSSFVLIFICTWLFPMIAIWIKLTSPGPVFFIQDRSGKRGRVFSCLKFRSMTMNSHSDSKQATKDDDRITPIGRFLRKTSLDEFPQFINVFKGEMSVVGPRPHMLKHTKMYGEIVNKFMVRHFAKPGITGWAQIKGFRGETKKVEDMRKRAEADIWYLENWNLMLDVKIIFLTLWNIVTKKDENAY